MCVCSIRLVFVENALRTRFVVRVQYAHSWILDVFAHGEGFVKSNNYM